VITRLRSLLSDGWIRSTQTTRGNRLPPGQRETCFGPWHVVLAQDPSQTWCGKRLARSQNNQWSEAEPVTEDRRCVDCASAWERGTPYPRANPSVHVPSRRAQ
jgi:hypothetical protein